MLFLATNPPASASGVPVIFNVTNSVGIEGNLVCVTADVTDSVSLASVTLS